MKKTLLLACLSFALNAFTNILTAQTIVAGSVSGSPFCAGVTASIPYTISGTFTGGNIFTAQLSSSTGSFTTPVSIGTLTATASGTISAVISSNSAAGSAYRIRVVELFVDSRGLLVSELNICNGTGSLVAHAKEPINNHMDISMHAQGIYIAEIKVGDISVKRRWVKMWSKPYYGFIQH